MAIWIVLAGIVLVALLVIWSAIAARSEGYLVGGDTIVRCTKGHLFTTMWVPGVSLKAVRLGMVRLQRCPVGQHWAIVQVVHQSDLTYDVCRAAAEHHDIRVP